MVGDDQFSFPVVSNPVSHLLQSSPLWQISSRVYHHDEAQERAYNAVLERSAMEREVSSIKEEREEVVEEKIDMLWQDFFCEEEKLGGLGAAESEGKRAPQKQLCVAPGGDRIATRGAGGGVVTIVKLLKKMHLIRNNSAHNQQARTDVK